MKPSTAIRKARTHYSLSPFGNQWQVVTYHDSCTTSMTATTYAQARQWYKESVAATALILMGYGSEDATIVNFCNTGMGTVQELVERCIERLQ